MTNESLPAAQRPIAATNLGLMRWTLWFLLVSFWAAWGLCVAAFVFVPDPRRLYNHLIGRIDNDNALLGVTTVSNPQVTKYVLAILFITPIIYFPKISS